MAVVLGADDVEALVELDVDLVAVVEGSVAAFALCGGSALYLLTYSAIRTRIERRRRVSRGRFVAALLLLLPLARMVPAIAAVALVTAVWLALHTYELVRWREARAESRSLLTS
jgi:low temperature requirement protein LtrA